MIIRVQVLSKSVADAFSLDGDSETERFVRMMDKFFDCMNVRNFQEATRKRKPDLRPYRSPDDSRLSVSKNNYNLKLLIQLPVNILLFQWLENDFLNYFIEWEDQVNTHYKLKYEREKKEREENGYRVLASEKEANGNGNIQGDHCECGEEECLGEDEGADRKKDGEKPKSKNRLSETEKTRRKVEKNEKERMRRGIEKSQLARETRIGLNFTGKSMHGLST